MAQERTRTVPCALAALANRLPFRDHRSRPSPVRFAAVVGLLAALVSAIGLHQRGGYAGDFTWAWRAARLLAQGQNPYRDPGLDPIFPYPFDAPLLYPLTAVVIAAPFALFPAWLAGSLFFGCSAALLAYVIARSQRWYLLPLFLSAPFYVAATVAQWSPLVVASALAPGLAFLAVCKPSIGLPVLLTHGDRRSWQQAALFVLLTLPLLPVWPLGWLHNLRAEHGYPVPLTVFPGVFLLLALLRWRDQRARLLLLMALFPQRLWFYDQLPLWLVARNWPESLLLTVASWIGYWGWRLTAESPVWNGSNPADAPVWVVTFIYLAALGIVLWPNLRRGWEVLRTRLQPAPAVTESNLLPRAER